MELCFRYNLLFWYNCCFICNRVFVVLWCLDFILVLFSVVKVSVCAFSFGFLMAMFWWLFVGGWSVLFLVVSWLCSSCFSLFGWSWFPFVVIVIGSWFCISWLSLFISFWYCSVIETLGFLRRWIWFVVVCYFVEIDCCRYTWQFSKKCHIYILVCVDVAPLFDMLVCW